MLNDVLIADYMSIFCGNQHNYGMHDYQKDTNATVTNKLLTSEQYIDHLSGKIGLGVIPITNENTIKFAVIDIDLYDIDMSMYFNAIESHNLPLLPFRSKSGGTHLYLFLKGYEQATSVVEIMKQFSSLLYLDFLVKKKNNRILEIFPKQTILQKNSVGNWINMPYYNGDDTSQYLIYNGRKQTLNNAISIIKNKTTTVENCEKILKSIELNDAPPCLQSIYFLKALNKDSGRNNFIFSLGVYYKKANPEFFEQDIINANNNLQEPLSQNEIMNTVISSLNKKEYSYKCNEQPCVDFCRKEVCCKRQYGVGKEGGFFSDIEFGKLYQIKAYEPYYELEVKMQADEEYKKLRFNNEQDLIGQDTFLRLCFRELYRLPVKVKQSEWTKLINELLKNIDIVNVEADDDTSAMAILKTIFFDFIANRSMAVSRTQILMKRAYFDKKEKKYYFRASDLLEHCFVTKGFKYYSPSALHAILRDFNVAPIRIRLEDGRQLRVYSIDLKDFNKLFFDKTKDENNNEDDTKLKINDIIESNDIEIIDFSKTNEGDF